MKKYSILRFLISGICLLFIFKYLFSAPPVPARLPLYGLDNTGKLKSEDASDEAEKNREIASASSAYYHYILANIAEINGDSKTAIEEYKKSVFHDCKSIYLKKQLVNLYILTGDIDTAADVISEIAVLQPDDKATAELMAEISVFRKKPQEAVSSYEKILLTDPANKKALYNLGVLYAEIKEYEKAILYFEKYLQIEPESPVVYSSIGILYQKMNRPGEAELYLKKAQQMDGDFIIPLVTLAEIYEGRKEYKKALEIYEKLLEIFPADAELFIKAAGFYLLEKDYLRAKEYLIKAKKTFSKNQWIDYYLGLIAVDEKEYVLAINYFNESIRLNKKTPDPHMQKGYVFTIQEDNKNAVKSFLQAVKLGTDIPDVYFFLAVNYEILDKYKDAEKYLSKAADLDPNNIRYHFELGVVCDKLGKATEAENAFFKVIEIDSAAAQAYNYIGYTLADKNVKLSQAEDLIKTALSIDPENPAYIDSLGWVYYRSGRYEDSLALLKKASKDLDDPVIFDHLGDCYLAIGDEQMAVDNWEASYLIEKKQTVKKKIKKYRKNIKWSAEVVSLRATRCFKDMLDISGFVSAKTNYESKIYSISGPFFFKKPKQLRLEILGFFGVPQGLVLMRQGTVVYITPDKKKYNLTDKFFWIEDIFNIFNAEYFYNLHLAAEEDNLYVFKNDRVGVKIDRQAHTISEVKFSDGSIICFAEYKLADRRNFPHKFIFTNAAADIETTVVFKKLNLNKDIKIDLFNVPEE